MEKYLIDTNIFLEILLKQDKMDNCKSFLNRNIGKLYVSDFSLHSVGVILIRNKKCEVFNSFIKDIKGKINVLFQSHEGYERLCELSIQNQLDFDDAYQVSIAIQNELTILTMDKDFKKVTHFQKVDFLK